MSEINQRRVEQHLRNFERALQAYSLDEPLSRFLTRFFKENRQMGSSDRRMTTRYCYNYFRLGAALPNVPSPQRLVVAEFLCESSSDLIAVSKPDWNAVIGTSLPDKIALLKREGLFIMEDIFPFKPYLSADIVADEFSLSHLLQPDLFIRVQRKAMEMVVGALTRHSIPFEQVGPYSLRLPNGTRLQEVKSLAGLYEVQDQSSQQSLDLAQLQPKQSWWDVCAASGGKSLLLLDREPTVELLVSDIRLSILRNLDERFDHANIRTPYRKKILDLTEDVSHLMNGELFDGIILDAPCSGSGTWGRTPEMISQFFSDKIAQYAKLQMQIARQVLPYLKVGGQLIYVTCSVFADENERITKFLSDSCGMRVEEQQLIEGYNRKSDSMFAARLRKM
ncbi:RsmB/NOP family class I SAM-dependent RNA methyltransferase [Sphingobacterium griseoflavum]|uniref:RNA methyltransferase n=1 Tax=Sphingobacterium griseoflavum TaxID=1474952 RepID=A0ABQ3HXP9_9SPHI|nr:RsmB/NOP family class I SAM-dependent RNA methyltransferase [Sphingobacterium griseoflavum]GHE34709.1 RNA methyltransferase [Sphingobacterium griseoflavum]